MLWSRIDLTYALIGRQSLPASRIGRRALAHWHVAPGAAAASTAAERARLDRYFLVPSCTRLVWPHDKPQNAKWQIYSNEPTILKIVSLQPKKKGRWSVRRLRCG
jgi:hypothetical protein